MHKKCVSESGSFNPRVFLAFLLCAAGSWLAMFSFAATPTTGTISDTGTTVLNYSAGPFTVSNPTPVLLVDSGPQCHADGLPGGTTTQPCDDYTLTATISAAYLTAHPNAAIKVTSSWADTGSGNSDYDSYIYKIPRTDCNPTNCTNTDGSQTPNYSSATGSNPEVALISPLVAGTQQYTLVLVPYTATREVVNVRIELIEGEPGGGGGGGDFGGPDPTVPGNPRYQTFYPPVGSSAEAGSGEFNIGFDRFTGRIMTMNAGPIWRITPPELLAPAKPECCEGLWQDRSSTVTDAGLDPILWTDYVTGRTFASNNTTGPNAVYAYTDAAAPFNDGDTWVPVGVSLPTGGVDHQTIGSGPYPASLAGLLTTPVNQGQYVLYCSQNLVGATCARSDTLGTLYGAGQVATGPGAANSQGCGGLHGHTHVAPDGTAYMPDNSCGAIQGGSLTIDAGTTPWSEFIVQKPLPDANGPAFTAVSQTNGADPSIGIDAANTVYYCYVNNEGGGTEGHAHVAVGKRVAGTSTINWIRDTDVGLSHGIKNAAHTEAVGGSAGRAACGFYGTNQAGANYQALDFAGKWYAFVATTYDEGVTWVTVNATPNDPVQSMTGIWQQGGGEQQRNLLDFNEITIDNQGRVLYGYSDGCVSAGCVAGTAPNDFTAHMRVARQFGGKPLYAAFDPNPAEPALCPNRPASPARARCSSRS